jgi:hypothetical protein
MSCARATSSARGGFNPSCKTSRSGVRHQLRFTRGAIGKRLWRPPIGLWAVESLNRSRKGRRAPFIESGYSNV